MLERKNAMKRTYCMNPVIVIQAPSRCSSCINSNVHDDVNISLNTNGHVDQVKTALQISYCNAHLASDDNSTASHLLQHAQHQP